MNKKTLINVAYWGMILVVIATCIFIVIYLKGNGKECVADPLNYYMSKSAVKCFCSDLFIP